MAVGTIPSKPIRLRWGGDIKSFEALKLPPAGGKAAGLKEGELKMARQLIEEMSSPWDADDFRDSFKDEIMRLVRQKADAGEVRSVEKADATSAHADADAEVIDLTELLKRSLQGGGKAPAQARPGRQAPRAARGPPFQTSTGSNTRRGRQTRR